MFIVPAVPPVKKVYRTKSTFFVPDELKLNASIPAKHMRTLMGAARNPAHSHDWRKWGRPLAALQLSEVLDGADHLRGVGVLHIIVNQKCLSGLPVCWVVVSLQYKHHVDLRPNQT